MIKIVEIETIRSSDVVQKAAVGQNKAFGRHCKHCQGGKK